MPVDKNKVIESGNAAFVNPRKQDTVIFESGNIYQLYGRKNEHKVKRVGEGKIPDFDHWDDYHFQRQYKYLGFASIIKVKRTLKLQVNIA